MKTGTKSIFDIFRSKFKDEQVRTIPGYDPEKHQPVIRSSICTGEKTAGYRDRKGGEFHEVMLIMDENDLDEFRKMVDTDDIPTIY